MPAYEEIIKPKFPLNPDDPTYGEYRFLASIGIKPYTLESCCVRKGRVTGVQSRQTVQVLCDNVQYNDVPVWIHTDVGARAAVITDTEMEDPQDYFKDAALMFPFPGNSDESYNYVSLLLWLNPETEVEEAVGVIGILQGLAPDMSGVLTTQSGVAEFMKNGLQLAQKTVNTYRPYAVLRFKNSDNSTRFISMYDILGAEFARVPVYVEGIPEVPFEVADFVLASSSIGSRIYDFLSKAIKVESGDCFTDWSFTPFGINLEDPNHPSYDLGAGPVYFSNWSGLVAGDITFNDRDGDGSVSITRRNLCTRSDNYPAMSMIEYDQQQRDLGLYDPNTNKWNIPREWVSIYVNGALIDPDPAYKLVDRNFDGIMEKESWFPVLTYERRGEYNKDTCSFTSTNSKYGLNTSFNKDWIFYGDDISEGVITTVLIDGLYPFYTYTYTNTLISNSLGPLWSSLLVQFNKCFLYDVFSEVLFGSGILQEDRTTHLYTCEMDNYPTKITTNTRTWKQLFYVYGEESANPESLASPFIIPALTAIKEIVEDMFPDTTDQTEAGALLNSVLAIDLYVVPYDTRLSNI